MAVNGPKVLSEILPLVASLGSLSLRTRRLADVLRQFGRLGLMRGEARDAEHPIADFTTVGVAFAVSRHAFDIIDVVAILVSRSSRLWNKLCNRSPPPRARSF